MNKSDILSIILLIIGVLPILYQYVTLPLYCYPPPYPIPDKCKIDEYIATRNILFALFSLVIVYYISDKKEGVRP